jgi:curved DNA-binding protein
MKFIDYYEVLGVSKTATEKEIKTAYRKMARKFHPDLHKGDGKKAAEAKFKLINEAYEVLGDTEKRSKYDRLGSNWQAGQEFNPPPDMGRQSYSMNDMDGFGFSDFFSNLFGQDFSRQHRNGVSGGGYQYESRSRTLQGENIEAEIRLTIEEMLIGTKKDLRLATPQICSACAGRRFSENKICSVCRGAGEIEKNETVTVTIPPCYDGMVLRLKGLGGKELSGGMSGDLYLQIQALPHAKWRINKQVDLESDLTINPEQAVLGVHVLVATPRGNIEVKISSGTHTGQKLRLKSQGFKGKNGAIGDIYIRINIDLPHQQTAQEIQLYEQIAALRKG